MKLVLVESPAKIHTISKILGSGFTVLATAGHIMEIDSVYAYKTGIDVSNDFKIAYKFDPKKKDLLKKIKDAAKNADEIFVCSDPDREGEKIADEVRELLKTHKKKIKRAVFNEITDKIVKNAIANPIPFDEELIKAAEARASIDKLTGYRLSPIALSKLNCESAGRVQSALLKLICEKEKTIQKFKSSKYWEIFLNFKKGRKVLTAKLKEIKNKKVDRFTDKTKVDEVHKNCKPGNYKVVDVKEKERLVEPKLPFTTSTMQQAASSMLSYNPQKTMSTAQHLFEKGLITYHRTDSVRFSDEFITAAKSKIEKEYGKDHYRGLYVPAKQNENSQNGHESIRPTDLKNTPEKMSQTLESAELKLYKLIYTRALASLFVPAKVKDTEVIIENGDYKFSITGKTVIFESFLQLYSEDSEDSVLPVFKVGEVIVDIELYDEEKKTQPPARYSEAGLVKLMQDTGIGRPSSYAGTIETLKKREYIRVDKKSVIATDKGLRLDTMLQEYFSEFINTEYTSKMETELDQIASGDIEKLEVMKRFWGDLEPLLLKAAREVNKDKPKPQKVEGKMCPQCGKQLIIRKNKQGQDFICCSGFPKCRYTSSMEETGESITMRCPTCGEGLMVRRKSKKGEFFYGCNKWPKCSHTMSEEQFKSALENAPYNPRFDDKE